MSFKPYTEKIKKKIGICSILGRIRIHYPGSGSADHPYQNDTDPKHCFLGNCYKVLQQLWLIKNKENIIKSQRKQHK